MLIRPAHARRFAGHAVTLAACLCALPLLVPRTASAATAGDRDDRGAARSERTHAPRRAAATRATDDADGNAAPASVIVGGEPSHLFRTMLTGVGVAGLTGGSAVLLAHPAAATPAAIAPTGASSVASPTTGGTATGTTDAAIGSTSQPAIAPPVPLPAVQPAIDIIVNPEPATLALFGAGALAVGALARRRTRA